MSSFKGRILCTEDHADTRELLIFVLQDEGYQVVCTDDPEQTLDLAKKHQFDLYLIDSWLPGVSGLELTSRIREFDPNTPILFYSGAGRDADKEAARKAGAQGYLVKPIENARLVAEVNRLIAESRRSPPDVGAS